MIGDTDDYSAWVQRLEPIAAERVGWMDDRITELTERLRQVEDERDEARAALTAERAYGDQIRGALWKQQAVEDHELECLYCLHNDDCNDRQPLVADAGVARADALMVTPPITNDDLAAASSPAPTEPAQDEGAGSGS